MITFSSDRHSGLSYGAQDTLAVIAQNRTKIKKQHGIAHFLSARQIHGDKIFIASKPLQKDLEVDGYDALLTNLPAVGLLIQQADCQAITLYDSEHHAIAAIHSGWKGSVLNITGKTVQSMSETFGSSPIHLQASISPSLGPCCAEFVNHDLELPTAFLPFQVTKNHFSFWEITKMQLLEAGLQEHNINTAKICTSCSEDYYSYRRACRNGDCITGRCATIIAL
jgi:YfiH family protein